MESPAHDTVIRRSSPSLAEVSLRDKDEIPNRDFTLRWTLDAPEVRTAFFAYRPDPQQDGYFALLLQPRNDPPASEIAARELFFLLDTSGSMQGPPLDAVKRAVRRALETLRANDTFQIVDFADTASTFAPAPLTATPENVSRGVEYLQNLRASGGTNQLAGIHAALAAPGEAMRVRYVVFMTDGYIGNEAEVIGLTQREIGPARIFGFGVGASVNRYLLNEVSLAGRGVAEFLRPQESPDVMVQRFYERIASPYLVDLAIDWGGLNVRDVYPAPLPDLSSFQPMLVFGRYRAAGAANVTVRGRVAGRPFERSIALNLPATTDAHVAIARLWAREKIAFLSREMHRNGERPELVEAVTQVALENHLVSQFTSLVAVDSVPPAPTADTPPARQVNQPADAPEGVNLQSAGGTTVPVAGQVSAQFNFSDDVVQGQLVRPDGAAMQYRVGAQMAPPSPPSPGGSGGDSDGAEESGAVLSSLHVERRRGGCSSCSVASAYANARDATWWVLAGVALVGARRRLRTSTRARPERAGAPRS
jgi:Ca-activated chloride channel family protein